MRIGRVKDYPAGLRIPDPFAAPADARRSEVVARVWRAQLSVVVLFGLLIVLALLAR